MIEGKDMKGQEAVELKIITAALLLVDKIEEETSQKLRAFVLELLFKTQNMRMN